MTVCAFKCRGQPAEGYHVCRGCIEAIRAQLREIEAYEQLMRILIRPVVHGDDRRAPVYRSASPANDDVLTALDLRSKYDTQSEWPIVRSVCDLADWIRDTRDELRLPARFSRDITYLRNMIDWLAHYDSIVEASLIIGDLHNRCRYLVDDAPPKRLGRCLRCDTGNVYPFDGTRGICGNCGHVYGGLALIEYVHVDQRFSLDETLAILNQEADRTGDSQYRIKAGTLRQWVYRGYITLTPNGYSLAEIYAYLTRRKYRRNVSGGHVSVSAGHAAQ